VKFGKAERVAVILGAADGLTLAISEIMSLRLHQPEIFRSGLGAGLGELVGMTAALFLSADDRKGFLTALGCGVATAVGCVAPCLPFLDSHGPGAFAAAAVVLAAGGGVVCWVRPQKGLLAVAETYGVLAVAGALCFASSLV
jgi:hypothetical protein